MKFLFSPKFHINLFFLIYTVTASLENYFYFLYNIISVKESTYVNNYQLLKGIVGKEGAGIYAHIMTTICGA